MSSGPLIHPLVAATPKLDDEPAFAPRLRLKPKGSLAGQVDGSWWPRSRDLAVELPALARVLAVRLGRITRVDFPLAAWDIPPSQIIVDGGFVRLRGLRHQDEYLVHLSGSNQQPISLLVIPQDATATAAHRAMMAAAGRDNIDQPADLLAAARAVSGVRQPRLRLVRERG